MTITRLTLRNFKSYADATFLFDPVTTIFGLNHHGKTNAIVAIRLLFQHEDWPERFIKNGTKEAWIEVENSRGVVVRRTRTAKTQFITINVPGEQSRRYTGPTAAEKYVREVLGVYKVELVAATPPKFEDLNFIPPLARPRLLLDPPEQVQKQVAAIVGGTEIEQARARIASRVRRAEDRLGHLEEDILPKRKELKTNEVTLGKLEVEMIVLEALHAESTAAEQRATELSSLKAKLDELDQFTEIDFDSVKNELAQMKLELDLFKQRAKLQVELDALQRRLKVEGLTDEQIVLARDLLNSTFVELEELRAAVAFHRTYWLEDQNYGRLLQEEFYDEDSLKEASRLMGNAHREKVRILKEMRQCPVCGQKTDEVL